MAMTEVEQQNDGDVVGYIAQCVTCPQRVVLHLQPAVEWQCPRCAPRAALGAGPVVPEIEPTRIEDVEPDWPIGQVRC